MINGSPQMIRTKLSEDMVPRVSGSSGQITIGESCMVNGYDGALLERLQGSWRRKGTSGLDISVRRGAGATRPLEPEVEACPRTGGSMGRCDSLSGSLIVTEADDRGTNQVSPPGVAKADSEVDYLAMSLARMRLMDTSCFVGWILAVDPTSVFGSAKYSYGLRASCVIHGYCRPLFIEISRNRRNGLDDLVGAPFPDLRWEMESGEESVDRLGVFLRYLVAQLVGVSVKLSKLKCLRPDRVVFERLDVLLKYKPLLNLFRESQFCAESNGDRSFCHISDREDGTIAVDLSCEELETCELLNIH
ncbi:Katanin p60 ATPase-containing subunit A1 [Perkinsus olseni]|uniref:Katanin p60 ATPase-containing subunit A1 n=1 Tax=Perkinsus olseni TaxID=32597 RepID=A0A7J6R0A2_PEROL|nr:Katanin p60 ATPase-containing subunit A1 [Perkinsus olseni]